MIIKELYLKNAIGIYNGLNKHELTIDFTSLPPGLIAIAGETGCGKTTVMENMTPYRRLASRGGALYYHFFGDGIRRVTFSMPDGSEVVSEILIDAEKRKMIATLYQDGEPLNDKLDQYDDAVEKIFGPEDIFFKSVFVPQNSMRILDMREGEIKKLFESMFDLEKYRGAGLKLLSEQVKGVNSTIAMNRGAVIEIEKDLQQFTEIELQIEQSGAALEDENKNQAGFEKTLKRLDAEKTEVDRRLDQLESLRVREGELQRELAAIVVDVDTIKTEHQKTIRLLDLKIESAEKDSQGQGDKKTELDTRIARHQKILKNKDLITGKISELEDLTGIISQLDEQINGFDKSLEISGQETAKITVVNGSMESRKTELTRLLGNARLLDEVPCSNTDMNNACLLLDSARKDSQSIDAVQAGIHDCEEQLAGLYVIQKAHEKDTAERDRLRKIREEFKIQAKKINAENYPVLRDELSSAEQSILHAEELKAAIDSIIEKNTLAAKSAADDKERAAQKSISDLEKKDAERIDISGRLEKLFDGTSPEEDRVLAGKLGFEITSTKSDIHEAVQRISDHKSRIDSGRRTIDELNKKKERADALSDSMDRDFVNLEEWGIVEQSLKEIPILELETKALLVTNNANELLNNLFSSDISLKIQTEKTNVKSGETKDAFRFIVYTQGEEVDAKFLSGGQKGLVDAAIRMAIEITIAQTSNIQSKTSFWDESDGNLDVSRAIKFLEMLQRVRELSNKFHTFFVSHRTELLGMADHKIMIGEL